MLVEVYTIPDVKLCYTETDRTMEWKIQNKPTQLEPSHFHKGTENIRQTKGSFFSKWCWENWISTCRKLKLEPYLSPCAKTNLQMDQRP
jgi:hypothetical protein